MSHNEDTRVKIPAILHLARLGYTYISLNTAKWDKNTNIFTPIFNEAMRRLNPKITADAIQRKIEDIALVLDSDDLGEAFYTMLTATTGVCLIDFKNFENNTLHCVTELTYQQGDEEFRPDITLLINGMPLAFVEVKKPNNQEGILAERERMDQRFQNKKFRKFVNAFQLLVFSNNMEYDAAAIEPIQGAFYATTSYHTAHFNYFREQENLDLALLLKADDGAVEDFILRDNNLVVIKHNPEYLINKAPETPTNRLLTSLFSKNRLAFLLQYSLTYVKNDKGAEKHIMRYPQIFATKAIEQTIQKGIKKGIIWHTQGSGKTALTFYNVKYLTDYFQKKTVVPKFYFIVDRIDLMNQAKAEFESRGLKVHTVNSKDELLHDFRTRKALHNNTGKAEITVVNIQKFKDDPNFIPTKEYDLNTQRVYFLDEVHRSYNPTGSFLANLVNSDKNAIIIGLTGTPLIGTDRTSRDTFGDYIHKYYYNASIADGYTLKLLREDIETTYKTQLKDALKEIEILKGAANKTEVYAHPHFVEPMLDFIVNDFMNTRNRLNDHTIGAMVVCDSSAQAKTLFDAFIRKYNPDQTTIQAAQPFAMAAEPVVGYENYFTKQQKKITAELILHDIGAKNDRKAAVEAYKEGKIDILFVYNMLLTGFDAKRLKKLYLARIVKDHNLLQTLTRVNRPYKKFQYGYVVDFADISKEFDKTNKAYFDELQKELGSEIQYYTNIFKDRAEIEAEIKEIKDFLWQYDSTNKEIFSQQISEMQDRKQVLALKNMLGNAKNLYNIIRTEGHFDILAQLDFQTLSKLYNETSGHLDLLNLRDNLQNNSETTNLLNMALENVFFMFRKISEAEMVIADELKNTLRKTREMLHTNFDHADPQFISLYDELKRLFDKKNLDEVTQEDMRQNINNLQLIYNKIAELNRKNNLLKAKYQHDAKFARTHKRIIERGDPTAREAEICAALMSLKDDIDTKILLNQQVVANESFFERLMLQAVMQNFRDKKIILNIDSARYINKHLVNEYMQQFL